MKDSALGFAKTGDGIPVPELERNAQGWLLDCEIRQHSRAATATRRIILDKLLWFLRTNEYPTCGVRELRGFLAYLTRGHENAGGRWGNPQLARPVRPRTVHTYHGHLRTFFRWMIAEGVSDWSPMEAVSAPIARTDQVRPFSEQQIAALRQVAKSTQNARRHEAVVSFLYDTGVRASELCALSMKDLDQ